MLRRVGSPRRNWIWSGQPDMARIRTIKPEFWTHEDLSELPEATHMLAAALLNHADDEGYFNAHPGLIKAACCPLREPSVSIPDSLILLVSVEYLRLGTGEDGKRYGQVVTFDDHQRVNRPTPSKIKALPIEWDDSTTHHARLIEPSPPERKGKEQGTGNGKEAPVVPSGDESAVVEAYHRILPKCQRIAVLNPKRKKRITAATKLARQVAREQGWSWEPETFWTSYFGECATDPWMRGEVANPKNPSWVQNLDVLLAEDRFAGVMDRAIAAMRTDA